MYQRKVFERYLSVAEERQLFAAVAQFGSALARRDHAWMRLLRHTGIRVGSLAALTVIHARAALKEGYLTVPAIKRSAAGKIYLNRKSRQALQDLLKIRREMGYAEDPDGALVMGREHAGMSVRSFQHRMRHWCKLAGLAVEASQHWWRHTLGKRIMQVSTSTDPRGIVQRALNHSSINSSAVYTFPDRDDYERAMEEVA